MMNERGLFALACLAGSMISGCAGIPPKYLPRYAMPQKLPGVFEVMLINPENDKAALDYDAGTLNTLEILEAYQKENVEKEKKGRVLHQ